MPGAGANDPGPPSAGVPDAGANEPGAPSDAGAIAGVPNVPGDGGCAADGGSPPCSTPPCSAAQMKANLDKCDGGTGVWSKAKKEVGQDPSIEVGAAAGGFGGHADCANKKVMIAPNPDCCGATQTLIFELTNLTNCSNFAKNAKDASAGDLDREGYTKAYERLEYESVKNSYTSFEKCSKAWGCPEGALARHGGYKSAKNFDDYYDKYLPDKHKDYWRDLWDKNFKSIYEKKHPPP